MRRDLFERSEIIFSMFLLIINKRPSIDNMVFMPALQLHKGKMMC